MQYRVGHDREAGVRLTLEHVGRLKEAVGRDQQHEISEIDAAVVFDLCRGIAHETKAQI